MIKKRRFQIIGGFYMLNCNRSKIRRIVAMIMASIMAISQSPLLGYAKEQSEQVKVQSEDNESGNLRSQQTEDQNAKEKNELEEQTPDVEQELEENVSLFDELKESITNSSIGLKKGLGTAANFGVFVNDLFQANAEFESNIAVKKFHSLVSAKSEGEDKSEQISYIKNFSDEKGNVLKENPLSGNYSIKIPYLVIGSVYKVFHDKDGYLIDGKRLGFKDNLKVIQEPMDKPFIDLDSEFLYLAKTSEYLADLKTTQTSAIKLNGNSLELESNSDKADIFNLSGADFVNGDIKKIKLHTLHENSTCVINVDLSDYSEFNLNAEAEIIGERVDIAKDVGRVIWNFYTKKVENNGAITYQPYKGKLITTATTGGTFLAPRASVEIANGNFYGSIISNDLKVNSYMKKIPFLGELPLNSENKKSLSSKATKIKVNAKATYQGNFDSKKGKGRRVYKVNLSAFSDTQTKESAKTGIKNAVIRYYISDYFDLTNECRAKLNKMKEVICQYDKNKKCQYVEWKNQVIPKKVKWTAMLELEAKHKFIGGNDIDANIKGSGIYIENTQVSKFPILKVNVPVNFQVQSVEGNIGKGELTSTDLYSKEFNKMLPVQDVMFDCSEIFLGKEPTGEFDYLWYQEGVNGRATLFFSPVAINSDTKFILKVIFKPYHTDTDTDGKKGLAVSTERAGNYNVHVSNSDVDKLEVKHTAVYTGDYNAENKIGKRTYSVKMDAKVQKTKALPKDIVFILENNKNIENNSSIKKDYKWKPAKDIKEDEWYIYKGNLKYYNVRIGKEEKTGRLRFYDDESNQYLYIDKGVQLYDLPDINDYMPVLDEEKEAVTKFVNIIKEISPESNICILAYSPDSTVLNKTEGFKNVSTDFEQLCSIINNISYGNCPKKEMILNEANKVLNDESVKNNGREKTVILCSELSESPNLEWSEAMKSAELLKNNHHADINVVNLMNTGSEYAMMIPDVIASINPSNPARKHYFATNHNFTIDEVLTNISSEEFGSIAGSSILIYLNENFQFTEESKKMFEKDENINYGFDQAKNQWYVKYDNQIIPTEATVWSKGFEIEAREDFKGGSNIQVLKSEISSGEQMLKKFPDLVVDVPEI